MRDNISNFKPKSELSSAQNLQSLIKKSKDNLIAFGKDCWETDTWRTTLGNKTVTARFSSNLAQRNAYSFTPMSYPFIDFAKAYIRDYYSRNPIVNLQRHLEALRILEEGLISQNESSEVTNTNGLTIEISIQILKEKCVSDSSKNMTGKALDTLFEFLRNNLIAPALPMWSSPFSKPKDLSVSIDEDGIEHRSSKLPSDETMMLMADLYHRGPSLSVEAEFFSSIYTILMTAPSRSCEISYLPVDCLVWEEDSLGRMRLGVQWTPAKNGKEGIKWVPSIMQDIVIEAIERIKRISEPARMAAKFAEEYPGKFWIHKDCITPDGFSIDEPLNIEQINAAISTNHIRFSKLRFAKWSRKLLDDNDNKITYRILGEHQYNLYTRKFPLWPYVDKNKKVKVSEALALFRENEFNEALQARNFSFFPVDANTINKRLSAKNIDRYQNLWERHGICLPNGDKVGLSSHQARHWLCTMAENGGMGELVIANWAGRAKLRDNESYDHRTEDEKSRGVRSLMIPKDADILTKIRNKIPITFSEIGKDLPGSAIVTELGICEHDYAILPCHRHGDCETCKELVCVKGFSDSLELLKTREKEVSAQLQKAMIDHDMGYFGADRWVSSHAWRLAHLRTKIQILEDEGIPNGTPVRIPESFDPTPVKETLIKKGMVKDLTEEPDTAVIDTIFRLIN